ncbi:MAG TPA: PRC-barrel domain-containing protein [Candidatus Methanomethylicus sp.]|nr:PRC-barrel domain-containing protein [Candidatus Methanomethylicus sp.]HRR54402.1 PRC-barrel domain-containing protein [Candidatus Methanomethylicus sp.]HRU81531.1 PRC-barrel domain-containing protein [Candidatus Methanomethylicus sp.]
MSEKAVTKDNLVGMQVIDAEAKLVGTVKDVAFTIGKIGISLIVENKKGDTVNVGWDAIQAVGDFIVLQKSFGAKAPPQAAAAAPAPAAVAPAAHTQNLCPTCGGELKYIPQYQRNYCYKCQKYA